MKQVDWKTMPLPLRLFTLAVSFAFVGTACSSTFSGAPDESIETVENSGTEKPSNEDEGVPGYFLVPQKIAVSNSAFDLEIVGSPGAVAGNLPADAKVSAWSVNRSADLTAEISVPAQFITSAAVDGTTGRFLIKLELPEAGRLLILSATDHDSSANLRISSVQDGKTIALEGRSFVAISRRYFEPGSQSGDDPVVTDTPRNLTGSCHYEDQGNCVEFYGFDEFVRQSCGDNTWTEKLCPTTNRRGRCEYPDRGAYTHIVYYEDYIQSPGEIQSTCESGGGTYKP